MMYDIAIMHGSDNVLWVLAFVLSKLAVQIYGLS